MGLPRGFSGDPTAHLQGLGFPFDEARRVALDFKNDDTLLWRLGVDECVAELVRALHSRAWARVGELATVLVTTRGARQGCTLGAMIFNLVYTLALNETSKQLNEKGLLEHVACDRDRPPWSEPYEGAERAEAAQATFVDDHFHATMATNPRELVKKKKESMIGIVACRFAKFGLRINWGKGKSAGMLRLRKKSAATVMDELRDEEGAA